jgi:nucleoid-associated protein YgaU
VAESLALIDEASSTGLDVLGVANSVGSTLGSFKSTPTILAQQWSQVVQGAGVAMASLSPVDPDANSILSSVFYQSEAQRIARAQVRRLQELQSQINASLEPVPDTFYVTRDGDNLRGISTLFYGTPSRWTEIQEKNKELLAGYNDSSNMPAGLTLTIPGVNQNG